jgi:3-deoxy-D-manno-octulosonic-acid transferase
MFNGYDIAYSIGLVLSSPVWLIRRAARSKVSRALKERMGPLATRDTRRPAVMIHAVSLGEINATRVLIEMLRGLRPDVDIILASTTDTGFARAEELYGKLPYVTLIRYPLDFTSAVTRLLDGLKPCLVILMELEVWPNFIAQSRKRDIPVILVNGRLTTSSYSRYRLIKPLISGMFKRLNRVCAQDQAYADRFIALGAEPDRVLVTGTMKFDTAQVALSVPGDLLLADQVGLSPGKEPIWVCGSTGPGEEEIILTQYRALLAKYARLRLVIVPRKPERFSEVSRLIRKMKFTVVRRSRQTVPPPGALPHVILGDTMGELRKFYSIADIVFVGRSLVDLGPRQHGSDMIEPAALAKAIIVGPHTGNFAEPMAKFREAEAVITAADGAALGQAVALLLSTPGKSREMGERAQAVVRKEQGATARNVSCIMGYLTRVAPPPQPVPAAAARMTIFTDTAALGATPTANPTSQTAMTNPASTNPASTNPASTNPASTNPASTNPTTPNPTIAAATAKPPLNGNGSDNGLVLPAGAVRINIVADPMRPAIATSSPVRMNIVAERDPSSNDDAAAPLASTGNGAANGATNGAERRAISPTEASAAAPAYRFVDATKTGG